MRLPSSSKVHAVGATGAFQKQFYLAGSGVPSVNPVIGLVGEEHVSVSIDRGALGEAEARRESDELPVPFDQAERIVDIARGVVSPACSEAGQQAQCCHENACWCLHCPYPRLIDRRSELDPDAGGVSSGPCRRRRPASGRTSPEVPNPTGPAEHVRPDRLLTVRKASRLPSLISNSLAIVSIDDVVGVETRVHVVLGIAVQSIVAALETRRCPASGSATRRSNCCSRYDRNVVCIQWGCTAHV